MLMNLDLPTFGFTEGFDLVAALLCRKTYAILTQDMAISRIILLSTCTSIIQQALDNSHSFCLTSESCTKEIK